MALPSNKTLILVRHAHRDTSEGRQLDNGLSRKGERQARRLRKFYLKRFGDESPVRLVSSAKKRCLQTLAPLAETLGTEVDIDEMLMEQAGDRPSESQEAVEKRVQSFINRWIESDDLITVACSHGDWLPLALKRLTGASAECKKGSWAEINYKSGLARLTWLVQKP